MRRKRYLFVWESVWCDYTCGIAFAIAANIEDAYRAMEKAFEDYPWRINEIKSTTPKIINLDEDYANGVTGGG